MHGDLDDNVPPSETLGLVDALGNANKYLDLLILPNQNHLASASGYLIRRGWDYFVRNLLREVSAARLQYSGAALGKRLLTLLLLASYVTM
jgi:hypothetical protein